MPLSFMAVNHFFLFLQNNLTPLYFTKNVANKKDGKINENQVTGKTLFILFQTVSHTNKVKLYLIALLILYANRETYRVVSYIKNKIIY